MLEFRVNGKSMGAEIALKKPASLDIEARVRFDPARDDVDRLEIVENGQLLRNAPRDGSSAEIGCRFRHTVHDNGWLALRSIGKRIGQRKQFSMRYDLATPASLAHSAPVYITMENDMAGQRKPRQVIDPSLERPAGRSEGVSVRRTRAGPSHAQADQHAANRPPAAVRGTLTRPSPQGYPQPNERPAHLSLSSFS